jgi:hypothetical protein
LETGRDGECTRECLAVCSRSGLFISHSEENAPNRSDAYRRADLERRGHDSSSQPRFLWFNFGEDNAYGRRLQESLAYSSTDQSQIENDSRPITGIEIKRRNSEPERNQSKSINGTSLRAPTSR